MSEKTTKNIKKSLHKKFTLKNIAIALIIVLFIGQYFQFNKITKSFDLLEHRESSLIKEIGELKAGFQMIGGDLNEVRSFLRMPIKDYAMGDDSAENSSNDSDQNSDQLQLAMFQYISHLESTKASNEIYTKNQEILLTAIEDEDFQIQLAALELVMEDNADDTQDSNLHINFLTNDGVQVISISLSSTDASFVQTSVLEEKTVVYNDAEDFKAQTLKYLKAEKDTILDHLAQLETKKADVETVITQTLESDEVAALEITIETPAREQDGKYVNDIYNKSSELAGQIILNKANLSISLVDSVDSTNSQSTENLQQDLPKFLATLQTMTSLERKVADAKSQLENTLSDSGFQALLKQGGLSVSKEPREDDERYYYDLLDKDGNLINSFVVEKQTAVVNVVDPDGTNSQNLLLFETESKKKTLEIPDVIPDYGNEISHADGTFNILIAGKHGNLMDTMIFAHIDEKRGDIRMISIPRDLHYNGRKINSFAFYYGMPELKKVLGEITGYQLDKYILIDMYAFIDVIDLIGGIDITLDKAVIDPTYYTVDNGVPGTLHYEPGDYHLGGKEALRLARTRHTSSDFARAERQQMILESLQTKARNFGFGDADTIYDIAKTVLAKTDTDISIDEALAYYFRYQNMDIASNDVMTSGNILFVPPYITVEECNAQIAAANAAGAGDPGCSGQNHAYTLIPRNENWNIIKWYFREKFED